MMMVEYIAQCRSPEEAFVRSCDLDPMPSISAYLQSVIDASPYTSREFFDKVALERTAGYRILDGQRRPSRNVLLRIALLMGMPVDKAQELLTVCGKACLNPRQRRDVVLIWALTHHLDGTQTEESLQKFGMEGLYRGK